MGSPGVYGFTFLLTIILGALILIGGILLLVNKTSGGILALIAGAVYLTLTLTSLLTLPFIFVVMLFPYSLEIIFAIIGGIIGIVAGSD